MVDIWVNVTRVYIWRQNIIRKSPKPPVPAKPNVLYSRGRFVDMVCWTVG